MAISFTWKAYATSQNDWTITIGETNAIGFYGAGGYGSPIQVGQYNDSMHVRLGISASEDSDACYPDHLTNLKYISDNQVSVNGAAPKLLTDVVDRELIRITVLSNTNITITGSRFYAFDGTNVENPPANVIFKAFKLGDNKWSQPHGRSNALSLGTRTTAATTHHFYIGMSLSPTSTGSQTLFAVRFEVDIV